MAKKTPATVTPIVRLRRCWGVSGGLELLRDMAAEPHQGDDEDEDHEEPERDGDRKVAPAPRLPFGLALAAGLAHRNSSRGSASGRAPARCSPRSVAKSRLR